jgi:hypothetical protein
MTCGPHPPSSQIHVLHGAAPLPHPTAALSLSPYSLSSTSLCPSARTRSSCDPCTYYPEHPPRLRSMPLRPDAKPRPSRCPPTAPSAPQPARRRATPPRRVLRAQPSRRPARPKPNRNANSAVRLFYARLLELYRFYSVSSPHHSPVTVAAINGQ